MSNDLSCILPNVLFDFVNHRRSLRTFMYINSVVIEEITAYRHESLTSPGRAPAPSLWAAFRMHSVVLGRWTSVRFRSLEAVHWQDRQPPDSPAALRASMLGRVHGVQEHAGHRKTSRRQTNPIHPRTRRTVAACDICSKSWTSFDLHPRCQPRRPSTGPVVDSSAHRGA